MVESWLSAPLLRPSSSRMTVFHRCHVLSRLGWSARLGGQIARSLITLHKGRTESLTILKTTSISHELNGHGESCTISDKGLLSLAMRPC